MLSRREWLTAAGTLAAVRAFPRSNVRFKLGVTDWNLRQTAKVEAVGLAASLGFDGVQISLGRNAAENKLPLDNPELLGRYRSAAQEHKVALNGTCLDILHTNCLKNDKLGQKWVADAIRISSALKVKVILLPFFGKGALNTAEEKDYVADVLRELGPEAEKSGVIFGLENTISAEDNVRIMERARSRAVSVYYDVGNSTAAGFDIRRELRWLGARRICQMHFKDNPHYLGEGQIDFPGVVHVLSEIGFKEWVNLETDAPSRSIEGDLKRNLAYVRKLMDS